MSNHGSTLPQCAFPPCTRTATQQPFEVELYVDPLSPDCPAADAGGGLVASVVIAFCSWHAGLVPAGDVALRAHRTALV